LLAATSVKTLLGLVTEGLMLRERAHDYTKKFVRRFLVKSGAWEWARLQAANNNMSHEAGTGPTPEAVHSSKEQQDDWRDDFEEALRELEEEEAEAEVEASLPETGESLQETEHNAAVEPSEDGATRVLNLENVQAVFDELVRPALQADGGDITLVKVEDNNVYVELIGACSTCPSATVTMKMGIEQMLHDEFPELGELINVAGEPQPFF
jgi:Fe-S cluster biogenesis protein NfuA